MSICYRIIKKILSLIVIIFALKTSIAQTIHGYISDANTGERLAGATVYNFSKKKGTSSNSYGFYSLSVNTNRVVVRFSFIGYEPVTKSLTISKDTTINIALTPNLTLNEVTVTANSINYQEELGTIKLQAKALKKIPVILGEQDIIKSIQLLPGVQQGHEGNAGMYVRGGSADQNLILLDGVPVYNVSHLAGVFSVFVPDAVSQVELIKGGFPARYGGRLSSVLNISMKEGNLKKHEGSYSIGLMASKFTIEGPLIKDKLSYIISGRRTLLDLLTRAIKATQPSGVSLNAGYYFYDANAKINYIHNENDRFFLSFYSGRDKLFANTKTEDKGFGQENRSKLKNGFGWGNITSSFRWNHKVSARMFSNLHLTYARYNYRLTTKSKQATASTQTDGSVTKHLTRSDLKYFSGIEDFSAKMDFDYYPSDKLDIKFGAGAVRHLYSPGEFSMKIGGDDDNGSSTSENPRIVANEIYGYAENEVEVFEKFKINTGLRYTFFNVQNKTSMFLEPRLSAKYKIDQWLLKLSYSRMVQNIHLLASNGAGLPTDIWVPATKYIPAQKARQFSLGAKRSIAQGLEFSIDSYYKWMSDVVEYKDGVNFMNTNINWEDKIETGKGRAYGIELFLKKKKSKLTGWIGYTLAWSDRLFDNINKGKRFPYKFDRRYDLKCVLMYDWKENIDISAAWVFSSGNAITLPTSTYQGVENNFETPFFDFFTEKEIKNNNQMDYIEERNNVRMKPYHRLDLSVNFRKQKKHGKRTWSLGVYNVYSRQNPYFYFYHNEKNGDRKLKQFSLLPIIPSATYRYDF